MMTEIAPRIVVDPHVRFGKPVIRGTRVPVDIIVGKLAGGMSQDHIAEEYAISLEDVRAALGYATAIIAREDVLVLA